MIGHALQKKNYTNDKKCSVDNIIDDILTGIIL